MCNSTVIFHLSVKSEFFRFDIMSSSVTEGSVQVEYSVEDKEHDNDGYAFDDFDEKLLLPDFQPDEYIVDSSDEEDIVNTIGNVPLEWYRDFDHLGYDIDAKKILRPERYNEIDNFLAKHDDPNYWRTVTDPLTGRKHVLTSEEIGVINSIMTKMYPTKGSRDLPPKIMSKEVRKTPINNVPPKKEMFEPLSRYERRQIERIRSNLSKYGLMKKVVSKQEKYSFYDIWSQDSKSKTHPASIPAPKMALPAHEESYNPPHEFLLTADEKNAMLKKDPEERELNFIPRKFPNLRTVPSYPNLLWERFERCLDLYLCPRQKKLKVKTTSQQLLPKLPKPSDLKPFPYQFLYSFEKPDASASSCLEVSPDGMLLASGYSDGTFRVFDSVSTKCLLRISLDDEKEVNWVSWSPRYDLACAVAGTRAFLIVPKVGNNPSYEETSNLLNVTEDAISSVSVLKWRNAKKSLDRSFVKISIKHKFEVTKCKWHRNSEYFLTICPDGGKKESIYFHRLSKQTSQLPFTNLKGKLVDAEFHLTEPSLWVVSTADIRLYDLVNQCLKKKLRLHANQYVRSFAQHSSGDNFLVGGIDYKLTWFDSALSTNPYHTMDYLKSTITCIAFHPTYPLFSCGGRNGLVVVIHATVTDETNAVIVPLKQIQLSSAIRSVKFHPSQPWLFVALETGEVHLYVH